MGGLCIELPSQLTIRGIRERDMKLPELKLLMLESLEREIPRRMDSALEEASG